jgi:hypothetical protein
MEGSNIYLVHMAIEPMEDLTMDLLDSDADLSSLFSNTTEETTEGVETEVNENNLFEEPVEEDTPESVDSTEETIINKGENPKPKAESSSTLSSILTALKDDGILPDVDEALIKNAKTSEDFAEIIEAQVAARMDEADRRIKTALEVGVPPNMVQEYENVISYLNNISEDSIEAADENAENIRKQLIYQDYINKGFKPERAQKELEKSIAAGTDIEDAKSALEGNKEFYNGQYSKIIEDNTKAEKARVAEQKKLKESFIKKINDTVEPFDGLKVDPLTKKKILDNATKIVEKDSEGNVYTSIQKYIKDNPADSQYYLSLFYTLTDGFKNIDKLVAGKVAKSTKRVLSNLDKTLNSSSTFHDSGNPLFAGDDNSKVFNIDI